MRSGACAEIHIFELQIGHQLTLITPLSFVNILILSDKDSYGNRKKKE
jgi:hypothetical protein